jgi:hypothetical protein
MGLLIVKDFLWVKIQINVFIFAEVIVLEGWSETLSGRDGGNMHSPAMCDKLLPYSQ